MRTAALCGEAEGPRASGAVCLAELGRRTTHGRTQEGKEVVIRLAREMLTSRTFITTDTRAVVASNRGDAIGEKIVRCMCTRCVKFQGSSLVCAVVADEEGIPRYIVVIFAVRGRKAHSRTVLTAGVYSLSRTRCT